MRTHGFQRRTIEGIGRLMKVAAPLLVISLALLFTQAASAQTYNVIHSFTGQQDGGNPFAGLTIDSADNIYGTTFSGGAGGFGTVFSLDSSGSDWVLSTLHNFANGNDGAGPIARLVFGPGGALYGTTSAGGGGPCLTANNYHGCGTIYKISPPPHAPASLIYDWGSDVLFRFNQTDGSYPQGDLMFDANGTMYGTAVNGGTYGWGLVYTLTQSHGSWTENVLYQPRNNGDGQYPWGGVVADSAGNLYGVLEAGGQDGYGAIYKLARSGSSWQETTLHSFSFQGQDGAYPESGLIMDASGNLYGATSHLPGAGGSAYQMTASGGSWTYDFVSSFTGGINVGPYDKLVKDAAGNLYGTTFADGQHGYGSVFKLTPSGGGWTYHSLHDFTGGQDGANPMCSLAFDSSGNIYGTASGGGAHNAGVVFEITP
jgi:uncharacterized repeat protein (TIGR03803 family)